MRIHRTDFKTSHTIVITNIKIYLTSMHSPRQYNCIVKYKTPFAGVLFLVKNYEIKYALKNLLFNNALLGLEVPPIFLFFL